MALNNNYMHDILNTCWLEDIVPLYKEHVANKLSISNLLTKVVEMLDTFAQSPHHGEKDALFVVLDLRDNYNLLAQKYGDIIEF